MKRVVHVYKRHGQWTQSPPGIGDFIRGTCHLHERLAGTGAELRLDLSQTEFSALIEPDSTVFHHGDPDRIAAAPEFFVQPERVIDPLREFLQGNESEFYLCTNLGAWDRTRLPESTRAFAKKFYTFTEQVTRATREFIEGEYVALSIRCGDKFYGVTGETTDPTFDRALFQLIEKEILPRLARRRLVVMSDCYALKQALVARYGFITSPFASQHGAFGNVLPVAVDLNVLKNSQANFHINAWQPWWSGFSHYTSLVFGLPSINFRAPLFVREEVTPTGELRLPAKIRVRRQLQRVRAFLARHIRRQPR
jgi:hypothetical protein